MKISISYFYNIRFFPKNIIPISTAVWDPKWFHDFKSSDTVFIDKRGVVNGIRAEILSPYKIDNCECKNCKSNRDPTVCSFIKQYRDYIFSLNFDDIYSSLLRISRNFNNADICLIVYEKPDNPCSERSTLVDWFAYNNIIISEYSYKNTS